MSYYRPSWDDYFMAVARLAAARSTCDRLRAGAVLVKDRRILATGYNGAPPGLPHCDGEAGHLMEEGHCIRTVHSEENCVLQAAALGGISCQGSTVYSTHTPCYHCLKKLIVAGVKRVVTGSFYRFSDDHKKAMQDAGITFEVYQPDAAWLALAPQIVSPPTT